MTNNKIDELSACVLACAVISLSLASLRGWVSVLFTLAERRFIECLSVRAFVSCGVVSCARACLLSPFACVVCRAHA